MLTPDLALKAIAGDIPWPDPDMGYVDLARAALSKEDRKPMDKETLYRSLAHLREVQCDAIEAGRKDLADACEAAINTIRPDIRAALDAHVDR